MADLTTTARKDGGSYVLNGQKAVVLGAPLADKLIVTARSGGGQRDGDGITVLLVDRSTAGVSAQDYTTIDGLRAADVTLKTFGSGVTP